MPRGARPLEGGLVAPLSGGCQKPASGFGRFFASRSTQSLVVKSLPATPGRPGGVSGGGQGRRRGRFQKSCESVDVFGHDVERVLRTQVIFRRAEQQGVFPGTQAQRSAGYRRRRPRMIVVLVSRRNQPWPHFELSATAEQPTRLLRLSTHPFNELIERYPHLGLKLFRNFYQLAGCFN